MLNQMYATLEGFELPRPLLMPDARSFSDVLEYVSEWDHETTTRRSGASPPKPRYIPAETPVVTAWERRAWRTKHGRNEVGPFCTIDLSQLGGKAHRSVAVRATDAVMEAVAPRIVTPDDHLSFNLIGHKSSGRVLVILQHGYIIGSHWLAYIDPATIPAYPYEARDARARAIHTALEEAGHRPIRKDTGTEPHGIFYYAADEPRLTALVHSDGSVTRTWLDGTTSHEAA